MESQKGSQKDAVLSELRMATIGFHGSLGEGSSDSDTSDPKPTNTPELTRVSEELPGCLAPLFPRGSKNQVIRYLGVG